MKLTSLISSINLKISEDISIRGGEDVNMQDNEGVNEFFYDELKSWFHKSGRRKDYSDMLNAKTDPEKYQWLEKKYLELNGKFAKDIEGKGEKLFQKLVDDKTLTGVKNERFKQLTYIGIDNLDVSKLTNEEHPHDLPPDDKHFEYIDTEHENEEYCPKCANKLREIVKKTIAECWKTHKQVGTKKKGGKTVPNCVPKNEGSSWDGSASKNPGMWDGKPSEKQRNKPFPAMGEEVDEAKTKPAKGKRFAKKVKNKKTGRTRTVSYGQAGKAKKGGDRIRPGTKKGHAYCARSAKIKKCKNPPCANTLSRKKWKCQGSRSVK